jgi:hypothetical protein
MSLALALPGTHAGSQLAEGRVAFAARPGSDNSENGNRECLGMDFVT